MALGYRTLEQEVINPPYIMCSNIVGTRSIICKKPREKGYSLKLDYHKYEKPKTVKRGGYEYTTDGFYMDEDSPDVVCNNVGNELSCEYTNSNRSPFTLMQQLLEQKMTINDQEIDSFYIDTNREDYMEFQEMAKANARRQALAEKRTHLEKEEGLHNEEEKSMVAKNESAYSLESIKGWGAKKYKELKNWWIR